METICIEIKKLFIFESSSSCNHIAVNVYFIDFDPCFLNSQLGSFLNSQLGSLLKNDAHPGALGV